VGMQVMNELLDIIDRIDVFSTIDIYDLSWYTLYLMEAYGKPSAMNNINNIDSMLKMSVEENKEFLHMVLYDKELIVGILLGYYILLKNKFYNDYSIKPSLSKVLEAVKNYIDEYNTYGEVLYALKKLDTVTDMVRKFIDIDSKIKILFNNSRDTLLRGDLRIEHAEDLSYVIWIICENKAFSIVGKDDLMKAVLDDRLYNLVSMDYKSIAVYANALANFILKSELKYEKDVYNILRERSEEVYKTLKFYIKTLSHSDEGVSKALIGKMRLGIRYLDKALQRLKGLNKIQKVKRKYGILSAALTSSVIILIAFPTITYILQSVTILGAPINYTIISAAISLLLYIVDDIYLENRVSKLLIEVLKSILRTFVLRS